MVPVWVEDINPLTFGKEPAEVAVTFTETVQELALLTLPPVGDPKVRLVSFAAGAQVGVVE